MDKIASTNGITIESQSVCLLYESSTGVIRHRHNTVTLKGGKLPAEAEIEVNALAFAGRSGIDTSGLAPLHVDANSVLGAGHYEVDPTTRTLKFTSVAPPLRMIQAEPIRSAPSPVTRL